MGTWIKSVPPKAIHDKVGLYNGQWFPEMDRCWIEKETKIQVCSRLIRTSIGKVEHVTITVKGLTFDGSGDLSWNEKMRIKNELFGEDRCAVEVYPKQKRLIDVADVYHLWVFDKKFDMPFGIHPKEYQKAVNRGYSTSDINFEELEAVLGK